MVEVSREGEEIVFNVKGLHKLWAFKSRLQIPRQHILGARKDPEAVKGWWHGWRVPGTHIPGLLTAGTFLQDEKRIFWDVHHADKTVVIDLDHEDYNQLIIEVENPDEVVALLSADSASHAS
ncbi:MULTISPECIES: hypothetical protein [Hymenobacter]|uniref:Uncharacterized protein n=1 Tax=Hymenobacter jejuensis TaxID=2502781 RepID=A0A5B7ZWI1_9BACT|nr:MULTISPECIES: hypothetical protein [Hymenobacter]MBC6988826.1 hypothetical protein [Hymenobacter sp. BT491]QDA58863.1 hypothetical protein FHG12_01560 [Hymenobacter jejuensis]